ncbi:MAG TPA: rhodanese-like domain-containing protein, partial [Gaiellales bacterium]
AALPALAEPPLLGAAQLARLLAAGGTVVDVRQADAFDAGHLAGAVNLPLAGGSFGTRAGWLLDAGRPLAVVGESAGDARRAYWQLAAVGLFGVRGVAVGVPEAWRNAGLEVRVGETIDPVALARGLTAGEIEVLDVRDADEHERMALPGGERRSLWELADWQAAGGPPLVVACASGARAAIAASVLRARLSRPVLRLDGGVADVLAALAREPVAI